MKDGKIQWHPAFGAALRIELADELEKVQIENEHLLSSKPMQVDYLVVIVDKNQKIRKNIGQLFRRHNIIEYKSPEDSLSINDFYKVYGYACFYQAVMDVILQANWKEAEVEKEMCETLRKLFAEELEEEKRNGVKQGITALVKAAYDWKMPKHEVIQKIVEEFQITGSEAENFVKAYYK